MAGGREWMTTEVATLRWGYAHGLSAACIGVMIKRSPKAVWIKAQKLGIKNKHSSLTVAVELFEQQHGKALIEIAVQYRERRLSRAELAADIGISDNRYLRRLLPPELWQSWPHNTVGRQLAAEQRRA